MQLIIDRIENNQIIFELEDKSHITISKELLPNAKENDIYNLVLDNNSKKEKEDKINNLVNELFK